MIIIDTYYGTLEFTNAEEWGEHIDKILKANPSKSPDELLEEIFTFDFKIEAISQQRPSPSSETQNL